MLTRFNVNKYKIAVVEAMLISVGFNCFCIINFIKNSEI